MRLTSRFAVAILIGAAFTTAFSAAALAAGNNGSITSRAQLPHREIVRVTIHTPQDMRDLQILDLDMTEAITPTSAEVVVTNEDKATLARHGFLFTVVVPRMALEDASISESFSDGWNALRPNFGSFSGPSDLYKTSECRVNEDVDIAPVAHRTVLQCISPPSSSITRRSPVRAHVRVNR